MNDKESNKAATVSIEKRILNEFAAKILNEERLERIVEARRSGSLSLHSTTHFRCECDDKDCTAIILMSTEEYKQLHRQTNYFVVVPSHLNPELEKVITSLKDFTLAAKYFPHSKNND